MQEENDSRFPKWNCRGAGNRCYFDTAAPLKELFIINKPANPGCLLRQSASLEDRRVVPAAARPDQEHHILAALCLRLDPAEVVFIVDGLLVDFEDHVTAVESRVLAKAVRLDLLNDYTLAAREFVTLGHVRGDAPHRDAELALLRLGFLTALFLVAEPAGKKFGAVGNDHIRRHVLAIADVAQLGIASRLQSGNLSHQLVATLHLFAVHRNDGVACLQAGLVGGPVGSDVGNGYAAAHAVNARYGRVRHGVELNSDGTARDFVLRANQLVVHRHNGVGRHGKADALVATSTGVDRRVNADHFAIHVYQRSAGVARVDGGVGLDERLELPPGNDVAALGGNDAGG